MRLFCVLTAMCASSSLFAGAVHLINDSPYRLRAVIRGSDGSYLGEMIIQTQNASNWSDTSGQMGAPPIDQSSRSQTPYTVLWYCMSGYNYSINTIVASGATVTAQSGDGIRICNPQPNNNRQTTPAPAMGHLYQQHEPEAEASEQ